MLQSKNTKSSPSVARGNNAPHAGNSFSFSVGARMDDRPRKDGTHSIYLQIIINRKRKKIPMDIRVKKSQWDDKKLVVKKAHVMAGEYNMLILQAVAHANEVAVRHRLSGEFLTADMIKHSFGHASMRGGDFLRFMDQEIEVRTGTISVRTIAHHRCTLNKLRDCFPDGLGFNEVTEQNIEAFAKYMKVQGLNINTRTGNLKRWQVYVIRAQKRNYIYGEPFADVKLRYRPGDRENLTSDERREMIKLYRSGFITVPMAQTLQCFLFSSYTGIRIGDLVQVQKRNIVNGELVITPEKTMEDLKMVRIPLSDEAMSYINTAHPQWRFERPADQTMNELLKEAARICGIGKRVTYHCSRHTFATLFLEAGGDLEVLQKLLGHSDIKTTMLYVHVNDVRRKAQIDMLGRF